MSEIALELKDLKKTYNSSTQALKGIDLTVKKGEFYALLGPNGAGKSTAIGIICGLILKSSGKVTSFGFDLDRDPLEIRLQIGIVPQEFNFGIFEKCGHIVTTQGGYYGLDPRTAKRRAQECMDWVGLGDHFNVQARELSGGMKRRLMIARALVHRPKLLILDEPTAGVDIELRKSMWEFLTQQNKDGTTILLTTHYLEEAEQLCEKVAIINHGEIVENASMQSVLSDLNSFIYVFDTVESIPKDFHIEGCTVVDVRDKELHLAVPTDLHFHTLINQMSDIGIHVRSVREIENRLEQVFLDRTEDKSKSASHH